jgi:hypothetical protein
MDDSAIHTYSDADLEILSPEQTTEGEMSICACCCRQRLRSMMDEDGCGICDECLAP